jgi:hypothetical protein
MKSKWKQTAFCVVPVRAPGSSWLRKRVGFLRVLNARLRVTLPSMAQSGQGIHLQRRIVLRTVCFGPLDSTTIRSTTSSCPTSRSGTWRAYHLWDIRSSQLRGLDPDSQTGSNTPTWTT